jgi:hypothetical protein
MSKNDISNKTLVFLTVVAIFFSLFGTVTVLDKLGVNSFNLITGAQTASQQAEVNITIAGVASIILRNGGNVSFGSGSVSGGVYLSTNTSFANPSTFLDPGSDADADDITIENDGNVDVSLTINGSSAADFITTGTAPLYNFSLLNTSSQGAGPEDGCRGGTKNTSQIVFGVGATAPTVCSNFTFRDANDTLNVTIWLFIPADTGAAVYQDQQVIFTATQV